MIRNWTIEDLKKTVEQLEFLIEKEKNLQEKFFLKKEKSNLELYILGMQPNLPDVETPFMLGMKDLYEATIFYETEYDFVESFFTILTPLADQLYNLNDMSIDISKKYNCADISALTGAKLSTKETFTLVDAFYKNLDPELYSAINSVQKFVNFTNSALSNNAFNDSVETGSQYFVGRLNKSFISIHDDGTVSKLFTLIHEYGHSLHGFINSKADCYIETNFFCEIYSLFVELVALSQRFHNIDQLTLDYLMFSKLYLYYDFSANITAHRHISDKFKSNHFKVNKRFYSSLNKLGIDDNYFSEAINTTLKYDGNYVLSFLVAIELFHIYKSNKEKALKIFKELLNIPYNIDQFPYILERINMGEHLSEESEIIFDNFEKSLKKVM